MNQYIIEFKRRTPIGYKKWGTSVHIPANSFDEARIILNQTIEPFIEEKLGDEIIELEVEGKFLLEIPTDEEPIQSESTKYIKSLDMWFRAALIDKLDLSIETISEMVTFFIDEQEYELCDKLNEIRKQQTEKIKD